MSHSCHLTLLNIGNTHTRIATVNNGEISRVTSVPTPELEASDIPGDAPLAVASVVPSATRKLEHLKPFMVTPRPSTGIDWSMVDCRTLGADRIANTVMLSTLPLPAMCFDFGTAINCESLDRERRFRGGSISPGRQLMRSAMHEHTALLPLLPISMDIPDGLGCNTLDAMRLGIDGGVVGMVQWLIGNARRRLGQETRFIAIGGDARFFLNHIPGLEDGGEFFTLNGIKKAWELEHES